jgi:hypothetical protein
MTKNIILIFSMLLFAISANGQISQIKESVYFDSDKFELREAEEVKLTQLWDSLSTDSILRIYITGNTDNSADSFYNINLSKNRCNTIQDFFTSRKVSTDIFLVNYFGENKPIADNLSVQGKQENRRVDIKVIYKKQESLVIEEIIESVIDTCKGVDTTIILKNGTELVFNRCEYNEIKECLEIKSIRTTEELIESNLGLTTDDNIPLITCGMISICLSNCGIQKTCFDYPVKVRFPFPSDNEECLPCEKRVARVFNLNGSGTWTGANRRQEKISIVKVGKQKYYQMEVKCPDCSFKNCDCPRCDKLPKKERRKVCPKVKLKLPYRYQLIGANIFVDCPPTILYFTPDITKFIIRKNIAKTETKCYKGDHKIQVLAIDRKGDTVQIKLSPLANIKHKILFSHCKLDERDNQKALGLFPAKKRAFYRKYRIRKKDFKND